MRIFIFLFSLVLNLQLFSQIVFDKIKYDFGDLSSNSDRYVDILVTNKGPKKEFLLSVKKPANLVYLVNGQFMDKDSSLTIRIQVNQKEKGKFSYEVQVYTSDKDAPTVIKLTGYVTENRNDPTAMFQACPDFNTRPNPRTATAFELTVVTIDKETRKPLNLSSVTIIQNGVPFGVFKTNKIGEIKEQTPLGFTYFYGTHEGYFPTEIGGYINFQRNYVVLELVKKPVETTKPVVVPEEIVATKPVENQIQIDEKLELELKNEEVTPTALSEAVVPKKFTELDKENFDEANFKPINVCFVLDISASMRAGEKMELMKFSLYQLTDMLRKQDKISMVTYATDTKVLLAPTSGVNKDEIKKLVENLRAGGLTAGGAGIKLGYQQVLKSLIPDGTNQIIVVTDGDFNRNSTDYLKYVKKYKKKGVNMSIVGILNSEKDKITMQAVAENAGGRYVPVFKLVDAMNNLKQEIRFLCFRK